MLLFSSLPLFKGLSSFPMGWKSSRGWLCRRLCFLFLQQAGYLKPFQDNERQVC